jgi:hypothetical protein
MIPGGYRGHNTFNSTPHSTLTLSHPLPQWRCPDCRFYRRRICWDGIRLELGDREPVEWYEFVALGLDPRTGERVGRWPTCQ